MSKSSRVFKKHESFSSELVTGSGLAAQRILDTEAKVGRFQRPFGLSAGVRAGGALEAAEAGFQGDVEGSLGGCKGPELCSHRSVCLLPPPRPNAHQA